MKKKLQQDIRKLTKLEKELSAKKFELKIESALEKVRTSALAMKRPSDMVKVCKIISDQFKTFGVKNLRNVQTVILIEHKNSYFNYQYFTAYKKGIVEEAEYNKHPRARNLAETIKKSANAFLNDSFNGKSLEVFRNYRKLDNQFADPKLDKAKSVHFYFYSIGPGALGLSMYDNPLCAEEISLLKKFRNVFELAYKRYTDIALAEVQTREAKIEASLERVRAVAMGMKIPSDMLDVCKTVFLQLQLLNVKEIRNVQTAIFYEERGTYMNYEYYAKHKKTIITETIYTNNKLHKKFAQQMLKGKGETCITHIKGKKVKDWIDYQKTTNVFIDKYLKTASSLSYYWFSLGPVALGISTYHLLTEEEINLFKRFLKVFELAYQRFLDIELAIAQAREAQIEAALERVRSRSLAMHKSDELKDVIRVVLEQFVHLKINAEHAGFYIDYKVHDDMHIWLADPNIEPFFAIIPYFDTPTWNSFLEAKAKEITFHTDLLNFKEKNDFYLSLFKLFEIPEEAKKFYLQCKGLAVSTVLLDTVGLYIENFSAIPYTDDENKILLRFGKVFQQTYTRFLDLQKAEAQAREAKIEAALERVRAKAMAMHTSEDLSETVSLFFRELKSLNVLPWRCGVGRIDEETRTTYLTTTSITKDGDIIEVSGKLKQTGHPVLDGIFDHWKTQKEYFPVLRGVEINKYYSIIKPQIAYPDYPLDVVQYGHNIPFKEGFIFAWTENKLSEDELQIFRRFSSVLSLTYRRYLDLKEAEARTVEAIKQASLDRVRAEIASMRTCDDLNRITPIIWRELKTLGVPFFRCGVYIIYEKSERVNVYLTTPDGKSLGVLNLSFDTNEIISRTIDHWRNKLVYIAHWNKEDFINWTKSLINSGQVPNAETYQGAAEPPKSLDLHFVPFAQGMLYIGDVKPLAEDKLDLVRTLAEAFSMAYARYEDFSNLEDAKNKIEVTLDELKAAQVQLIHSEKMASLGVLTAGIAHEIKNPLNFVNNFSELSRELIDDVKTELQNKNETEVIELLENLKQNLEKINQHGKRADSIVKGMLLHSRGNSGEKALVDVNELVDQDINLAYHGLRAQDKDFNITIEKDYDRSIEKINFVPQDISRVILNLVNNACYAANQKKRKSGNDFSPILKVSTKNLQGKVEIRIRDNGCGIPQPTRKNIFNPFFTTKPAGEGTGLGLSISYDIIVKQHKGELRFESEEGKFTEFIIILPKNEN